MKVSVVIPVYNVAPYLPRCLDSLLRQTLREIEILCVDDGSTDGSADILDAYAKKDSRIQVIRQANAGAGAARNRGLELARGEYLFFFDPDDGCARGMLAGLYHRAEETQADAVLAEKLSYMGAVLVRGAKWCGKTTTCERLAKSILYMSDPDHAAKNRETARIRPSLLLKGATPRLIDEWQEAPELWDAVRFSVDHRKGYGQYILTGSAVPKF